MRRAYEDLHVANDPRTPAQQRADALVEICRTYSESRPGRAGNLPSVLLVSDHATLEGVAVGECRLASGYRISPETARRLLCDAYVQEVRTDADGVVLAMGRATRTFTPDQYRAMVVRDAHCRGPGCRVDAAHCEAHHLDEWQRDDGRPISTMPRCSAGGIVIGCCTKAAGRSAGARTVSSSSTDRAGRHLGISTPHRPPQTDPHASRPPEPELDHRTRKRARALRAA